jgi:hypothetical protein
LDDFGGHKHTWSELRGASHTVVDSKMSILATNDLQRRHPIKRLPVFGNLPGKLPGVSPLREAGRQVQITGATPLRIFPLKNCKLKIANWKLKNGNRQRCRSLFRFAELLVTRSCENVVGPLSARWLSLSRWIFQSLILLRLRFDFAASNQKTSISRSFSAAGA